MKTYNQKARKREPFKPTIHGWDKGLCCEVYIRRRVQIATREEYIRA